MAEQRAEVIRLAAVGDVHFTPGLAGTLRSRYTALRDEADLLLLAGDLTHMGLVSEVEALLGELEGVDLPTVAVLGNHDHEAGQAEAIVTVLTARGVQVLDGTTATLEVRGRTVGVAGVKGFCGGFAPHAVQPFGEQQLKAFIAEAVHEAKKLEAALHRLTSDVRVALLHYAPDRETLGEEPPEVYPFLGTSLLLEPIERTGVHAVVHGHAHRGRPHARTRTGVPLYNVAMPVIRAPYTLVTL